MSCLLPAGDGFFAGLTQEQIDTTLASEKHRARLSPHVHCSGLAFCGMAPNKTFVNFDWLGFGSIRLQTSGFKQVVLIDAIALAGPDILPPEVATNWDLVVQHLESLDGPAAQALLQKEQLKGRIFSSTIGPGNALLIPVGYFLCEKTLTTSATSLRKLMLSMGYGADLGTRWSKLNDLRAKPSSMARLVQEVCESAQRSGLATPTPPPPSKPSTEATTAAADAAAMLDSSVGPGKQAEPPLPPPLEPPERDRGARLEGAPLESAGQPEEALAAATTRDCLIEQLADGLAAVAESVEDTNDHKRDINEEPAAKTEGGRGTGSDR